MRIRAAVMVAAAALLVWPGALWGQPTRVMVRVVAHDAKIIGSGVGGARVTVRDPATGRLVATATQRGSTGDTERIMVHPVTRGETIYDTPGAAGVTLDLDLDRPAVLEFIGEGPLEFEESMVRSVKRMLVVPGEDILGDGIVLELHGFIVEWVEPATLATGTDASVVARVRMLCGCPHTPGGLWDADRIAVTARVYDEGRLVRSTALHYAGEPNLFSGTVPLREVAAGAELVILVTDADRANFGMSRPRLIR